MIRRLLKLVLSLALGILAFFVLFPGIQSQAIPATFLSTMFNTVTRKTPVNSIPAITASAFCSLKQKLSKFSTHHPNTRFGNHNTIDGTKVVSNSTAINASVKGQPTLMA